jgi:hypothetical protein
MQRSATWLEIFVKESEIYIKNLFNFFFLKKVLKNKQSLELLREYSTTWVRYKTAAKVSIVYIFT